MIRAMKIEIQIAKQELLGMAANVFKRGCKRLIWGHLI